MSVAQLELLSQLKIEYDLDESHAEFAPGNDTHQVESDEEDTLDLFKQHITREPGLCESLVEFTRLEVARRLAASRGHDESRQHEGCSACDEKIQQAEVMKRVMVGLVGMWYELELK